MRVDRRCILSVFTVDWHVLSHTDTTAAIDANPVAVFY